MQKCVDERMPALAYSEDKDGFMAEADAAELPHTANGALQTVLGL